MFAKWLIRVAAFLAPAECRDEWRREWLGELHASGTRQAGRGPVRLALGAPWHALWLRLERWRPATLGADLKFGVRVLAKRPAFAICAILTLGLGIGATTAVYSVAYGVLFKPLPYRDPARLVQLWESNPLFNWTEATIAPGNLLSWRDRNSSFTDIAFYIGSESRRSDLSDFTLTTSEPIRVRALAVSVNLFDVLGVRPELGRVFVAGEDIPGRHRVAVLSNSFWRRAFNADPTVIDRRVPINGVDYQIVGVMPSTFTFDHADTDFWRPIATDWAQARQTRVPHYLRAVARLKPGVTVAQANADLSAIARDLEREFPESNKQMGAGAGLLDDWFVGLSRRPLQLFLIAVSLVLLIACANVANLMLAQLADRVREVSVRAALGAGRSRIVRQLLAEALVMAIAGVALGAAIAVAGVKVFIALAPPSIPRLDEVGLHPAVALFAAAVVVVTTLVVGVLPALQAARADLRNAIGDGTRTTAGPSQRLRRVLVAAQVALAMVLLAGAFVTLRSFRTLVHVNPGFDVDGLVTAKISLPSTRYADQGKSAAFFTGLAGDLRQVSGVAAAGAAAVLPLDGQSWTGALFIERQPAVHGRELRHVSVTAGYFAALGTPIVRGRDIADTDTAAGERVVVINEALARQYFEGQDPVGQRIAFDQPSPKTRWRTIVGVVADHVQDGLGSPVKGEIYDSIAQDESTNMFVAIRIARGAGGGRAISAADAVAQLRRLIAARDPQIAAFDPAPFADRLAASVARERVATVLIGVFAAVALVLALVGLFGVTACAVSARMREMGVRIACGATSSQVRTLVVRSHLRLVIAGGGVGLVGAVVGMRAASALLYGARPLDVASLGASLGLLVLAALIACLIPARRAARVDVVNVLRS
ncbi:MAG TPA: ABC transporter permease [Vicinamibacterales bacterium]|nr:ABC transporter permease [Vicinamibacterales bacterium]